MGIFSLLSFQIVCLPGPNLLQPFVFKPFVLSLSKHERHDDVPFDKHVLSETLAPRQAFD
jgi:hypothetical protein